MLPHLEVSRAVLLRDLRLRVGIVWTLVRFLQYRLLNVHPICPALARRGGAHLRLDLPWIVEYLHVGVAGPPVVVAGIVVGAPLVRLGGHSDLDVTAGC